MDNPTFERLTAINSEEAKAMRTAVWEATSITLDENDPAIAMFLLHHRFLEDFYRKQGESDQQNAKEIFTALSPLIEQMKNTVDVIDNKHTMLQQDIDALNAFRDEMVMFFTAKATDTAQKVVSEEVKNQVASSLKTVSILMSVLVFLQAVMLLVVLFLK
ncbi:MAG: hypothetical protein IKZ88_02905 [Neisseriaceae bacterium]|nr:hypothetical protein [Neisseriaceae bacterium]